MDTIIIFQKAIGSKYIYNNEKEHQENPDALFILLKK